MIEQDEATGTARVRKLGKSAAKATRKQAAASVKRAKEALAIMTGTFPKKPVKKATKKAAKKAAEVEVVPGDLEGQSGKSRKPKEPRKPRNAGTPAAPSSSPVQPSVTKPMKPKGIKGTDIKVPDSITAAFGALPNRKAAPMFRPGSVVSIFYERLLNGWTTLRELSRDLDVSDPMRMVQFIRQRGEIKGIFTVERKRENNVSYLRIVQKKPAASA